ncbi:MAG: L-aspartate oxidase [Gemmatimonadota bacterium]
MRVLQTDVLVIGSGIAGLSFALKTARYADVLMVTKKDRVDSNTNYAQGGVAAAIGPEDSPRLHVWDTLLAGAGLCQRRSVEELAYEGPDRVKELIEWGVSFSRTESGNGDLALGREAGHSQRRILHAADLTGREIERALLSAVDSMPRIRVLDDHFAWRLSTAPSWEIPGARCRGALVLDIRGHEWCEVRASAVLLATGGCGRLFRHTTNPDIATGDGVALGYDAGAAVANLEFMQFHPTALYPAGSRAFLISEAVRGEGAILRGQDGEAFMDRYHAGGSLAPRDVVARAIQAELDRTGDEFVWLDASMLAADEFEARFPTIREVCVREGLSVPSDPIPVVPAAHYQCGGLLTDWDGRTTLPGLYAAGEVACTGVHGANRLASNSLLEAVVFAHRAARRLETDLADLRREPAPPLAPPEPREGEDPEAVDEEVRSLMWEEMGLNRSDEGLARARTRLDELASRPVRIARSPEEAMKARQTEFGLTVSRLMVRSARRRLESRGLHFNRDHPWRDSERFLRDTVLAR